MDAFGKIVMFTVGGIAFGLSIGIFLFADYRSGHGWALVVLGIVGLLLMLGSDIEKIDEKRRDRNRGNEQA